MSVLDRHFEQYQVNEVQARELPLSPEDALTRILALPAASDPIVRALFRIRGIRGGHLPLERFATDVLHLEVVERTATSVAAVGGSPLRLGSPSRRRRAPAAADSSRKRASPPRISARCSRSASTGSSSSHSRH